MQENFLSPCEWSELGGSKFLELELECFIFKVNLKFTVKKNYQFCKFLNHVFHSVVHFCSQFDRNKDLTFSLKVIRLKLSQSRSIWLLSAVILFANILFLQ